MPSPRRNKVIDLKRGVTKRDDRWVDAPRREAPQRSSKPQRLRARRRRQRALMFGLCLMVGAGLVGGAGFVSHLERFAIKDVSVSGAQELSANALTAAVHAGFADNVWKIFAKKNMFLYPAAEIEEKLAKEFPRIKEVELSRPSLLAQAVVVSVEERQSYATWCGKDGACFFMDAAGFVFAERSDSLTPASGYVFRGGLLPHVSPVGQTFLHGRLNSIVRFLELLAHAGRVPQGITVENEKDFAVPLSNGPTLLVPFDVEGERIIRDLALALEADSVRDRVGELEYVDLRFGNRVYYKFRGE